MKTCNSGSQLSEEEGLKLLKEYVHFFLTKRFYFSDLTEDDVFNTLYLKFKEKKFFERYRPEITTKRYFVARAVKNNLIDMSLARKKKYSLESEDQNGLTLLDKIPVRSFEHNVLSQFGRDEIIESLSDESKVRGFSPLLGVCKLSQKSVALHLEAGYKVNDIAEFFVNPYTKNPISKERVHQITQKLRESIIEQFSSGKLVHVT